MARLWSSRIIAVKRSRGIAPALFIAIRQFVLAGLPTTRMRTSSAALAASALPCAVKIAPFTSSSSPALHALRARPGADEQRVVDARERAVGVVGLLDAREQRERAVVELHRHTVERGQRGRDLEQLEDHGLVLAEHLAARDAEQQAVPDLTGSTRHRDAYGVVHGTLTAPRRSLGRSCELPRS